MRLSFRLLFLVPLAAVALLTSCTTMAPPSTGSYHVTALKPHDPSKVEVKLSTSTQNLYVMEGDRLLMAVQGNVGKPGRRPRRAISPSTTREKQAPHQPARCRLSDGLLVRVQAGVWIPRRLCASRSAHARLRPAASRSRGPALRADQDRHAGAYRDIPSRGRQVRAARSASSIKAATRIRRGR